MSSYDQNLLDKAPKATRAQLQHGYNVELLEQPPRRTPSVRNPPAQIPQDPVTVPLTQGIAENDSGEKFNVPPPPVTTPQSRASFWHTRNGIITMTIIALIVTGAVIGGAVGGTIKSGRNNTVVTTTSSSSQTTTQPSTTAFQNVASQITTSQGVAADTSRPAGFPPRQTSTTTASGQNI